MAENPGRELKDLLSHKGLADMYARHQALLNNEKQELRERILLKKDAHPESRSNF